MVDQVCEDDCFRHARTHISYPQSRWSMFDSEATADPEERVGLSWGYGEIGPHKMLREDF